MSEWLVTLILLPVATFIIYKGIKSNEKMEKAHKRDMEYLKSKGLI